MNEGEAIRVVIADDHEVVREGLTGILTRQKMQVVAEACNGKEAVELYRLHQPDILLMDLRMPLMDGLTATRTIVDEFPHAHIIVLTNSEGEEENSRQAGAMCLISKDAPSSELIGAIHTVHGVAS